MNQDTISQPPAKKNLHFLDGIRGLAALYIVFFHAIYTLPHIKADAPLTHLKVLLYPITLGHYTVSIFITLSGFLLMLPVVDTGMLRGGAINFMKRRIYRIMPPYYVCLLFFFLMGQIPFLYFPDVNDFLYPIDATNLLAHIFMIHNLKEPWISTIDSPMWSLASEFQIYCLFPLLLLPLYRRIGAFFTVFIAIGIGVAIDRLHLIPSKASPWYIGLFAIGMAAATIFASDRFQNLRTRIPFGKISLAGTVLFLVYIAIGCVRHKSWNSGGVRLLWLHDAYVSMITACFILSLAQNKQSKIRSFLESKPLTILGGFSYTLYLYHFPIQFWFLGYADHVNLSPDQTLGLMLGIALPISLLVSYLAYYMVERHFLNYPSQKVQSAS